MSIECPKCQTNNPDNVKFCGECGTPLEAEVIHTKTLETPKEKLTTGTDPGFWSALGYAQLGEGDKVFEHLERAYENHDFNLVFIKAWSGLEEYYSDPRFKALLKKMGLD